MQVSAPAKINLALKVLRRRSDGFHEIETLIAPISLCDQIEIDKSDSGKGIEFHCDDPSVPMSDDNLVLRAAKALFTATKLKPAVSIELKKRIPHGAGLGGGSSDAASTLFALNELFETKLPCEALAKLAEPIGQTFHSSLNRWHCRGRGRWSCQCGCRVLDSTPKPNFAVPTAWAPRWQDSRDSGLTRPRNSRVKLCE
jgi:4-diphosphocytidyl-2-C-methyl-D-erythritol kinase